MNYTPEEYRKALEPKREELEAQLIDLLTTTRKNKYARPDRAIKLIPTIEQPYGRGIDELAAVAGAFQAEVDPIARRGRQADPDQHQWYGLLPCPRVRQEDRQSCAVTEVRNLLKLQDRSPSYQEGSLRSFFPQTSNLHSTK